jgi:hypothetical protein
MTVALDRNVDDPRPWIEAARPSHPSLIDVRHRLADLYNIVNVPTVVWIDEGGHIVRPNDVAFGTDRFRHLTGLDSGRVLERLRAWVRGNQPALPEAQVRAWQAVPTPADQQARAEFGLGQWLYARGRRAAAERHYIRAGELAPHDFTIRRGTLPMRGIDPMGPVFRQMHRDWTAAGNRYYRPLPDTAGAQPSPAG